MLVIRNFEPCGIITVGKSALKLSVMKIFVGTMENDGAVTRLQRSGRESAYFEIRSPLPRYVNLPHRQAREFP
jgi:hypothetical protein